VGHGCGVISRTRRPAQNQDTSRTVTIKLRYRAENSSPGCGRRCVRFVSALAHGALRQPPPELGVVKEEVAVLIALVRRHRRAVGAAVRWAVGDEVPGTVEEEAGPAAVRRVPPGLLDALPVHAHVARNNHS